MNIEQADGSDTHGYSTHTHTQRDEKALTLNLRGDVGVG